jgi:hypothetical protein
MGSHLPYDAEVEYLKSDGSAYIDTGINATASLVSIIKYAFPTGFVFDTTKFLFGTYAQDRQAYSVALSAISHIRVPQYTNHLLYFENIPCSMQYNTKYIISYTFGAIYFNNSLVGTQRGLISSDDVKMRLFGRNGAEESNKFVTADLIVYDFKASDNGVDLIHFIPVVKDNVGCMYDKVSKQLFYNAGTGDFIVGPRITSGGGWKCLVINALCGYSAERRAA